MPWTCGACHREVKGDTDACPGCGERKASWTIAEDKTRAMVVGGQKRFQCLRGEGEAPVASAAEYAAATWVPTEVAPHIEAAAAKDLAGRSLLPAPRDVLVVREFPGTSKARDVTVVVEPAGARSREVVVPGPTATLDASGAVDARLVAVSGGVDGLSFPGLTVVDVTDAQSPGGHAPSIQVAALKRPAKRLQLGSVEEELGETTDEVVITRFVARAAPPAPLAGKPEPKNDAPFGPRAAFGLGQRVELAWTVVPGVKAVVLAGAIFDDVMYMTTVGADGVGQGSYTFLPEHFPPAVDGTYELKALIGGAWSAVSKVTVVGILRLEVEAHPDHPGTLYRPESKTNAYPGPVSGRNGALPHTKDEGKKDGDISVFVHRPGRQERLPFRFRWVVLGAGGVDAHLRIERNGVDQWSPLPDAEKLLIEGTTAILDVTAPTRAGTPGKPVERDVVDDYPPQGFSFDVGLHLVDPAEAGKPAKQRKALVGAFVRLVANYPDPEILDFSAVSAKDGATLGSFTSWDELAFRWRLNDYSGLTVLRLSLRVVGEASPLRDEVVKETQQKLTRTADGLEGKGGPYADPGRKGAYDLEATLTMQDHTGTTTLRKRTLTLSFAPPSKPEDPKFISVHEALQQPTGSLLLLAAGSKAKLHTTWPTGPWECPIGSITDPSATTNPVWSFELDSTDILGSIKVRNLRARVRDMDFAQFQVADELIWWMPEIDRDGVKASLPLQSKYFVYAATASDGEHAGSRGAGHYWRLGCRLDHSFLMVFGYEVDDAGKVTPIAPDGAIAVKDRKLLPKCPHPAPEGGLVRGPSDPHAYGDPLRVFVVVSLVCQRERNDFEPGGVLGAGRFYPHMMAITNKDFMALVPEDKSHIISTVSIIRPKETTETAPGLHGPSHACCGEMLKPIGPIYFTDTNRRRIELILQHQPGAEAVIGKIRSHWINDLVKAVKGASLDALISGLPIWCNFFDYYDLSGFGWKFVAISKGKGNEGAAPKVKVLPFPPPWGQIPDIFGDARAEPNHQEPVDYVTDYVVKLPRQGEFDSVHMAPRMEYPSRGKGKNPERFKNTPVSGIPSGSSEWGLDKVSMAPFCVHDCLHIHWRWSQQFEASHVHGWKGWTPYMDPGAAMAPPNQSVEVDLSSATALTYKATARGIDAGRWQVFLHHGASYALAVQGTTMIQKGRQVFDLQAYALVEPMIARDDEERAALAEESWTIFYWRLRFGGTFAQPKERLYFDGKDLADYRRSGLAAGEAP